jgi:hypothetical protein
VAEKQPKELKDEMETALKPPKPPRAKKTAAQQTVTKEFVQAVFAHVFNLVSWARKSAKTFESDDMSELAKSWMLTAEQFPFLNRLITWLAPVTLIGQFVQKGRDIEAERPPQPPKSSEEGMSYADTGFPHVS